MTGPTLLDGLRAIELPGWTADTAIRDATQILATVPDPLGRAGVQTVVNVARSHNARAAIPRLPADGETLHGWMNGSWDAWSIVPRLLELARPATVVELTVATLGFNKDNTESLLAMMDRGELGRVAFLCSHYFKSHERDIVAMLSTELAARGSRFAAARSHAKILLFEMTDGRCFVWRSSANLRSCRNMEHWDLTQDRGLLEFDRGMILGLMDQVSA